MSGNTTVEGYPYPLTSDFADVQDAFRLATAVDKVLRAEQAAPRAFMGRPSFIARQTATGSPFSGGQQNLAIGAIDWDSSGGLTVGDSRWRQPNAQAPSWWLLGATLLVSNAAAPVVGDGIVARIDAVSVDAVTNVSSPTYFYQRNDESNTGGEWLNVFGMAQMYRGSVGLQLQLNGTTNKSILAGTRLWGLYLGPVI